MKSLVLSIVSVFSLWPLAMAASFTLSAPEVEAIKWESRQLTSVDLNADGRQDLALIDGVEHGISLFIQKEAPSYITDPKISSNTPLTRLSRFERTFIPTVSAPSSFAFGDFNADGKIELAVVSSKQGLSFYEQDDSGRWRVKKTLSELEGLPYTHCLSASKLSDDSGIVLLGLFKGAFCVIKNYEIAERYATLADDPTFINLTDVNYDGRLDVVYEYSKPGGVAFRLQASDGRFDSEELVPYATDSEKVFAFEGSQWSFFGGKTSFLERRAVLPDVLSPKVEYFGTEFASGSGVLADIDADGSQEWIMSDPETSRLIVWRALGDSWGLPKSFPSLKGVSALAGTAGGVLLLSKDEKTIGYSHWEKQSSRMSFPTVVDLPNEPIALLETSKGSYVVEKSEKDFYLRLISGASAASSAQKLEGLKRDPEAVLAFRDSARTLIVALIPRETAQFYVLESSGSLTPIKVPASLARTSLNNLEASSLGFADVDDDKAGELLVANRDSLRLYKFTGGKIELKDQALSPSSSASYKTPFFWKNEIWVYDTRKDVFVSFERSSEALWKQTRRSFKVPMEPAKVVAVNPLNWLFLSQRSFYALTPQLPGLMLESLKRKESSLDFEGYNWGALENFGSESAPNYIYVLYNQPERIMEFVNAKDFSELMNFRVYDRDEHYNGRSGEDIEPREMISADVTGDGKPDMALIAHDRLLVYPQK